MRFFLLSDNVDTLMGMRLVGIEGEVLHERGPFLKRLSEVMNDPRFGIILITTKLVELAPHVISELKLRDEKTLIVEIPDRHGGNQIGSAMDDYVSKAIGVRLKGDGNG